MALIFLCVAFLLAAPQVQLLPLTTPLPRAVSSFPSSTQPCQQAPTPCQPISPPCPSILQSLQSLTPPCQSILPSLQPIAPPCQPIAPPCQSIIPSCQQTVSPFQTPLVPSSSVVTTVVDNSVSNSLANALQLLIVSNLIENTMNSPACLNAVQAAVTPFCDSIPVQASVYSPAIDVLTSDFYSCDPIPVSCELIPPCETIAPIIDVLPNSCYPEVITVPSCGCDGPIVTTLGSPCGCDSPYVSSIGPSVSCGCDNPYVPNIGSNFGYGCGCDGPYGSNIGPNYGCGCGCDSPFTPNFGCGNGFPSIKSILPSLLPGFGMPNIGCGCNNFGYDANPFGSMYGCDQYPPPIPAQVSYGYGVPNYSLGLNVEPCGNGYYY